MVITCFSALIVMLDLASLPSFIEDKTTQKRKQKERKKKIILCNLCQKPEQTLAELNVL